MRMYTVILIVIILICVPAPMLSEDVNGLDETLHNNIGAILQRYSFPERQVVRAVENSQKKHVNAKYAVLFNEFCIYI